MGINWGKVQSNHYIKIVSFSKAVLWKDKQLSLTPVVYEKIKNLREWHFIDEKKEEAWIFFTKEIIPLCVLKQVGQEGQYYFPIAKARIVPIETYKKFYGSYK